MKYLYGESFTLTSLFTSDIAVDIETTGLNLSSRIYSIGFSNDQGGIVFILCEDNLEEIRMILKWTLLNPNFSPSIVFHNGLFDVPFILRALFNEIAKPSSTQFCKNIFDTLIAARFVYSTQYLDHLDLHKRLTYSLKFLAEYYGISVDELYSFESALKGIKINFANPDEVANYNYKDCVNTLGLFNKFKSVLIQDGQYIYFTSHHMAHAFWNLFHMRWNGIPVDSVQLEEKISLVSRFVDEISNKVYKQVKVIFSFSSQNEISKAIFHNHFLRRDDGEILIPPFKTEKESKKVDIDTFQHLRKNSRKKENVELFNNIIAVMEGNSVLRELNSISENLVNTSNGFCVFPNQTVSAKSGRIRISKPNVHGQSKKGFKGTLWEETRDDK